MSHPCDRMHTLTITDPVVRMGKLGLRDCAAYARSQQVKRLASQVSNLGLSNSRNRALRGRGLGEMESWEFPGRRRVKKLLS